MFRNPLMALNEALTAARRDLLVLPDDVAAYPPAGLVPCSLADKWRVELFSQPTADRGPVRLDAPYTVVVFCDDGACVYLGSSDVAYLVRFDEMNETQRAHWESDLAARTMVNAAQARERYGALSPVDAAQCGCKVCC